MEWAEEVTQLFFIVCIKQFDYYDCFFLCSVFLFPKKLFIGGVQLYSIEFLISTCLLCCPRSVYLRGLLQCCAMFGFCSYWFFVHLYRMNFSILASITCFFCPVVFFAIIVLINYFCNLWYWFLFRPKYTFPFSNWNFWKGSIGRLKILHECFSTFVFLSPHVGWSWICCSFFVPLIFSPNIWPYFQVLLILHWFCWTYVFESILLLINLLVFSSQFCPRLYLT